MTPQNRRVREPLRESVPPAAEIAVPSSAQRGPSRWARVARTVLGCALVVASSALVAWAARRYVMTSPRFAVTDVEVLGNERRTPDAVSAESGISVGTNVFALDLDAARARILADPWIAEATLARRLPGTILVQIDEHKAAALVAAGDTLLVTSQGEPFKRVEPGDPVELPLVTGLRPEDLTEDHDGATRTIRRAIDLAAEYEASALSRRSPLEEVHVGADGTFTLVVGRSATELVLGGPPFRRKLDQAARVVAELDKRGAKADAIMLDNDGRPDRVVVRMR
ncbi:MAG TPA: FtsQ-type POTRA domain-containing protein [Polyangiaceae bacterium]